MRKLSKLLHYPSYLINSTVLSLKSRLSETEEQPLRTIMPLDKPSSLFYFKERSDEDIGGLSIGMKEFDRDAMKFTGRIDTERMEKMMDMPFFGFYHSFLFKFRMVSTGIRIRIRSDYPGQPIQLHLEMDSSTLPGVEAFVGVEVDIGHSSAH